MFVLLSTVILCLLSQVSSSFDVVALQNLFDQTTLPANYQRWAQPRGHCLRSTTTSSRTIKADQALVVNISLELYNYATVDELTSEYTFQFFLDLEWCDERLRLVESALDEPPPPPIYVEGGTEHIQRIWKPSIFVANNDNPGQIDSDKSGSNMVRIDGREGHVWLRKRKLLRIFCLMDFRLFPFDRQRCSVHFESNVHSIHNLRLAWGNVLIDNQPVRRPTFESTPDQLDQRTSQASVFYNAENFRTVGFKLLNTELSSSVVTNLRTGANYSRCTFEFTLEREFTHYLMLTYLPSAMIVIVSWSGFWLEITSPPARVSLGVTTMLAQVTSFKAAKSQLPTISYLNVLDIWNLVCTVFIGMSLVEFAVVNYIYNTPKREATNALIKQKSESYRKVRHEPLAMNNDTKIYLQHVLAEILHERQAKQDHTPKLTKFNSIDPATIAPVKEHESLVRMASFNSMRQKEKEKLMEQATPPVGLNGGLHIGVGEQLSNTTTTTTMTSNVSTATASPVDTRILRTESLVTFSTLDPIDEHQVLGYATPRTLQQLSGSGPNSGTNSPSSILKRPSYPASVCNGSVVYRKNSRKSSTGSFVNYGGGQGHGGRRRRSLLIKDIETKALIEMTPEEMANKIDYHCRIIFPVLYIIFNLVYWFIVFKLMLSD